jgi:hypothetical protein
MSRKQLLFFALFLLTAGAIYFYLYKDWLRPGSIQIISGIRDRRAPARPRGQPRPSGPTVQFSFDGKFALTEVKVVPVSDILTNKYPHALWHLVSDSNSPPVKGFAYGEKIRGMRPNVTGVDADPLEPNVAYRLIVEAGSIHGEHDFQINARPAR